MSVHGFFVQDESVKEFNKSRSGLLDLKAKLNNNGEKTV